MAAHTLPCSDSSTSMWDSKASEPLSGLETLPAPSRIGKGQVLGPLLDVRSEGTDLAGSGWADLGTEITWSQRKQKTTAQGHHHRHHLTHSHNHTRQTRTHSPCCPFTGIQPQMQTALTQNLLCGQHLLFKQ